MSETNSTGGMDGKTISIISYFTLIGWIVALILNNDKKDDLARFHIRQMLGLMVLSLALTVLSWVLPGMLKSIILIFNLALFALWIIGLIGAFNGEKKPIPLLGEQFQEWFKSL